MMILFVVAKSFILPQVGRSVCVAVVKLHNW